MRRGCDRVDLSLCGQRKKMAAAARNGIRKNANSQQVTNQKKKSFLSVEFPAKSPVARIDHDNTAYKVLRVDSHWFVMAFADRNFLNDRENRRRKLATQLL